MLNQDFKNGKKLDLHSAFSLFVILMGLLFYIDAAPGTHASVATYMMFFGVAWFLGHQVYKRWSQAHRRGHR